MCIGVSFPVGSCLGYKKIILSKKKDISSFGFLGIGEEGAVLIGLDGFTHGKYAGQSSTTIPIIATCYVFFSVNKRWMRYGR